MEPPLGVPMLSRVAYRGRWTLKTKDKSYSVVENTTPDEAAHQ